MQNLMVGLNIEMFELFPVKQCWDQVLVDWHLVMYGKATKLGLCQEMIYQFLQMLMFG